MLTGGNTLGHTRAIGMPVADVGDEAVVQKYVTKRTIEQFADLTGDANPLHLDEEYAAEGMFDGVVAHGMFGAGVISAALAELPGDVIYLSQDLSFEAPVRPDDTVQAEAAVVEDLGDDRIRVETVARTITDDESTVVIDGEAVVLSVPHEK